MNKFKNIWHKTKRFNTTFSVAIAVLFLVMLVFSNYANSQNLARNELMKDIRIVEDELRLLDAGVSQLQTTERIETESQRLDLVKIQTQDVYYLADVDEKVALK